ncbi:MAG: hypothetical protein EZS28_018026 [Streblomastix strix]|uniref:Uncharacterized protein n=1 Tax=Streblomastix strix TaxID=222440 RepID=A0A5J4VUX0_9EUKA|nr:MAG: hypothetical protein EZS28_018026 [Streblomastix strix]
MQLKQQEEKKNKVMEDQKMKFDIQARQLEYYICYCVIGAEILVLNDCYELQEDESDGYEIVSLEILLFYLGETFFGFLFLYVCAVAFGLMASFMSLEKGEVLNRGYESERNI